jgi:hypothetical protein
VGGKIQSFSKDGLIWEKGPNTMVYVYALDSVQYGSPILRFSLTMAALESGKQI